jgi:hypothetical protein
LLGSRESFQRRLSYRARPEACRSTGFARKLAIFQELTEELQRASKVAELTGRIETLRARMQSLAALLAKGPQNGSGRGKY